MKSAVPDIIRQFFTPPRFDDEEKARAANLLMSILQILLVIVGLYGLFAVATGDAVSFIAVGAGGSILLSVVMILRRGQVNLAGLMLALLTWALLTAATLIFGGLRSASFMALLLVSLALGTLLNDRARLLIAALTLASSLVVFGVESAGALPSVTFVASPLFDAVVRISVFLAAALILFLISRSLHDALAHARSSDQAVRAVLGDLVDATTSRAYLDNILRSITDILIVLDADRHIRRVNQAAVDLLGYSEAELVGQMPETIFAPDGLARLAQVEREALRGVATHLIARSGAEIPISLSASRLGAPDGQMQGIVCIAQNVSERERAGLELQRREELYRTLARSLPDMGVLLFDQDLRLMIAEGQMLKTLGDRADHLEGRSLTEVLPAESVQHFEPIYRAALAGERTVLDYASQDRHYQVTVLPVKNESGSIFAGLALAHDITSIRQAEDELRRHIEQLTILRRVDSELNHKLDVRYVLDLALDMAVRVSVSSAGAVLLLDDEHDLSVEHLIGQFSDGWLDSYPRPPDALIQQALDSGQAVAQSDRHTIIPLISRNRPIGVLLLESARPFTEERVQFMLMLTSRMAVAVDNAGLYQVSQRQLAEMQALYERVSQLEQLKTDMIRIAAHDLRNPINVVSGFAEMLLDADDLTDHERLQIDHIFQAARRMQAMVADILSLERIQQLQAGSLCQVFDLAAQTRQIFQSHQTAAAQHDFCCTTPDAPVRVSGDPPQISEAITNLIGNALKYTPAGGRVEVRLGIEDRRAALDVIDTGYGIPDDLQPRLFQPFYRARSHETGSIEGTGLGLHLVKNIVERHNGNLRFHSVYGQGSTFGFDLPLAVDLFDESASDDAHEPAGQTQPDPH